MHPKSKSPLLNVSGKRLLFAALFVTSVLPSAQGAALDDIDLSGQLMYFYRNRDRYDIDDKRYHKNLHHDTLQGSVDVSTPYYLGNTLGVELGVFATKDLSNRAGNPYHEISFFPWSNPWSIDWSDNSKQRAQSGFSLYRAHLKWQHGGNEERWWGKLGYFQPQGPGVLGVNWSLMPGTYSGAEAGVDYGALSLASAYVTRYKAPWYKRTYIFVDEEEQDAGPLWSVGARYTLRRRLSMEVAYGEASGYTSGAHLKFNYDPGVYNAHLKLKYDHKELGRFLTYQFYLVGDRASRGSPNNYYDGHRAYQHYVALSQDFAPWNFKAEYTYTSAPSSEPQHLGFFVYRLTPNWYGGSKGAYEPWWDNRSDWNHNQESAIFLSLSRKMDDFGWTGLTLGISGARGWGGEVYGVSERLKERAWSTDLNYRMNSGPLKDTSFSVHYTRYDNQTHQPSWHGFRNLFQDEHDLKILLTIPWKD